MKIPVRLLAALAFVFVLALSAAAQRPTRISFAKGAVSTVVSGNLTGYKDKKAFVIRVRRGQTLTTEQIRSQSSNRYITVAITDPTGEDVSDSDASCNNRKQVSPTTSGDYRLVITECMKADRWRGTFRLRITVK